LTEKEETNKQEEKKDQPIVIEELSYAKRKNWWIRKKFSDAGVG